MTAARQGASDLLRLVAALEGAIGGRGGGFVVRESERLRDELLAGDTRARIEGLLTAALAITWLAGAELGTYTGESAREVAERLGVELERIEERVGK